MYPGNTDSNILEIIRLVTQKGEKRFAPSPEKPVYVYSLPTEFEASPEFANKFVEIISGTNENTVYVFSSFQKFISEEIDYSLEDEMREDNPDEPEYTYSEPEEDDEEEARAEATRSSQTFSDLREIEAKLKSFEKGGDFDEEEDDEFGANPMDETPFGEKPDWVKELEAKADGTGYEAGGNPGECSECSDSDWMM